MTPERQHLRPDLDTGVLDRFRADAGDELLHLLIDTFVSDTTGKLHRLVALAASNRPGEEAIRLAHSLKSAGAMAGAEALSHAAASLEARLVNKEQLSAIEAAQLEQLFHAYRTALRERGLI